jgi:hypothetical protein
VISEILETILRWDYSNLLQIKAASLIKTFTFIRLYFDSERMGGKTAAFLLIVFAIAVTADIPPLDEDIGQEIFQESTKEAI